MRPALRTHASVCFAVATIVACGARTGLELGQSTGVSGAGGVDGGPDASGASGGVAGSGAVAGSAGSGAEAGDAGVDAKPDAKPDAPMCTQDFQCDDGIACTDDFCDTDVGRCAFAPRNDLCDDGLFCTGDEVCNVNVGCETVPRQCMDSVDCTVDACDEATDSCTATPDDSLCPVSHRCDPVRGCQARVLAHERGQLFNIDVPGAQVELLGQASVDLTDLALDPDGTLFGIDGNGNIMTVDANTGATSVLFNVSAPFTGLDSAPDGTIFAAGGLSFYRLTMGGPIEAASFPPGLQSSGDIAFLEGRMLASATSGAGNDVLVEVDLATASSKEIGSLGFDCVWGLAAFGDTLYGFTCNGEVLRVNPNTASSTVASTANVAFWGATAR